MGCGRRAPLVAARRSRRTAARSPPRASRRRRGRSGACAAVGRLTWTAAPYPAVAAGRSSASSAAAAVSSPRPASTSFSKAPASAACPSPPGSRASSRRTSQATAECPARWAASRAASEKAARRVRIPLAAGGHGPGRGERLLPAGAFRGLEEWTGDCRRGAPVAGLQPHQRHGQLGVRAEQPRPTRRDRDALDHAGCLVRKGERALVLPEEPRRPGQMSRAAENLSGGLLGVRGGGPCLEHGDGLGRAPQLQQDPTQRRGGPALPFAAAQLGGERVGTAAQLEGATVVAPSAVDPAVRIEEQRLVAAIAELAVERERLISPCERLTEVPPRQRRLGRFEQGPGEEERVATAAMDLHEFLAMTRSSSESSPSSSSASLRPSSARPVTSSSFCRRAISRASRPWTSALSRRRRLASRIVSRESEFTWARSSPISRAIATARSPSATAFPYPPWRSKLR